MATTPRTWAARGRLPADDGELREQLRDPATLARMSVMETLAAATGSRSITS
jgi:hypothetical protein